MRFVILTQYYTPEIGAAQVRLSSFARELVRAGHQVTVVTAMPNYPTGRVHTAYRGRLRVREEREGIPVIRTWIHPSQSARFLPRLASYFSFAVSACFSIPGLTRPDFFFVESPPLFLGLTGHCLARLFRTRWMMNVSDLWPDTVVELGMLKRGWVLRAAEALERGLYRRARFVVAVTDGIRERLHTAKAVPDDRLLFLPNGADTDMFRPRGPDINLTREYSLEGKAVFLFAGLHGHAQDLPNILAAAAILRDRQDIAVVFVGDGPVKDEAQAEATRMSLHNVHFLPPEPLERMPRWWSIARGALVTLRDVPLFEGARPSKALPPLASGVPVIFAGRGELATILTDAAAGIVVPPGQPARLADALVNLTDHPAVARQLGTNARTLAEQRFSWRAIVSSWLADLAAKEPR